MISPRVRTILTIGGWVLLVASLFLAARWLSVYGLARYWQHQLDVLPDEETGMATEALARLGSAGVPPLVEAMGSQRECVARAAKGTLIDQIEAWQSLPTEDATERLEILTASLADQLEDFPESARLDAIQLATLVMLWPKPDADGHQTVIANCRDVLDATRRDRRLVASRETERSRLHQLPAGGSVDNLVADTFAADADRNDEGPSPDAGAVALERRWPVRSVVPDPTAPPADAPTPMGQDGPALEPIPPHSLSESLVATSANDDAIEGTSGEIDQTAGIAVDDQTAWRLQADLSEVETVELMRWLQAFNDRVATRAESELRRRHFSDYHLALARRLFSPDVSVRRDLADRLPSLADIDATIWLEQLSHDPDPQVRIAAISHLATTGNPAVLRRLYSQARVDTDPRVRQLAERLRTLSPQPETKRR